ncbi:unnamed protein product [Ambrosiozyma monospora]|uniref:Unnamed protein product n=1 Tax=Ambrosiozyma monospora TaxID=43982 RepID=A0ACB5TLF7_AMBMO|nr:unnamed protein product [Ambrosiozyma monospora]
MFGIVRNVGLALPSHVNGFLIRPSVVRSLYVGLRKNAIHDQAHFSTQPSLLNSNHKKYPNPFKGKLNNEKLNKQLDKTLDKTKHLTSDVYHKSLEFKDKSKQLTTKTLEKSYEKSQELKSELQDKSKEISKNIKRILPKDFHENIYTLPNFLTVTRLISAPIVGYLILHGQTSWALSLFAYSCITDFVDGYIARKWNLQSMIGSVIDPLADKALMIICTACMASTGGIPFYMAALILGRDFGYRSSSSNYGFES